MFTVSKGWYLGIPAKRVYWIKRSGETIRAYDTRHEAETIAREMNERHAGHGTFHLNSAFCKCNTCCD